MASTRTLAASATVHVVPDGDGVADALSRELVTRGFAAPSIGATVPDNATHVLVLASLGLVDAATQSATVLDPFRTLRALAATHRERAFSLVVAQTLGGDFGLEQSPGSHALLGATAGLAKSAAQEWPRATVRVVDLTPRLAPTEIARLLANELSVTRPEIEIGLRATGAVTPRLIPVTSRGSATRTLEPGSVWVISGGARGVTADCIAALCRRVPLRVVLLGRTAIDRPEPEAVRGLKTDAEMKRALHADATARGLKLTPADLQRQVTAIAATREAQATCAALQAAGSEVRYHAVDTSDAAAVAAIIRRVRTEWGPVRGLVHAAGVLADKALHEKTDEQFLSVFRTKVDGFQALLAATQAEPLDTIVCFSSVAARAGNAGQSDYAAANEALNKLCQVEQHRRGDRCHVRSINWGPWDGGMVGAGLKAHFAARGIAVIPRLAGAEVFADIVTGALATTVECVVGAAFESASRPPAAAGSQS